MNVSKVIYALRKHKKWSQEELSSASKVSVATIWNIENKPDYAVSSVVITKLADAFQCPTPIIYLMAMESTDCYCPQQVNCFLSFKFEINSISDLIYNAKRNTL